ncbi:MAG TPA: hypothetical protein VL048_20975 [Xanthobacteraceae bacterium]|nr:hypothetical protein [Xanthobacteraceae bacterium]
MRDRTHPVVLDAHLTAIQQQSGFTERPSLMTTLSLSEKHPAPSTPWRRGLARIVATVTGAFETAFAVIDEAADQSAAARRRFPTAD